MRSHTCSCSQKLYDQQRATVHTEVKSKQIHLKRGTKRPAQYVLVQLTSQHVTKPPSEKWNRGNHGVRLAEHDRGTNLSGLAVKCCTPAPLERSPAFAPAHRLRASSMPSSMLAPRGASAGPQAPAAQLARRNSSDVAEAGRRSRDKRRRRTHKHAKRSMWRESQALRCCAMWGCCEDTSNTTPATPSCHGVLTPSTCLRCCPV